MILVMIIAKIGIPIINPIRVSIDINVSFIFSYNLKYKIALHSETC